MDSPQEEFYGTTDVSDVEARRLRAFAHPRTVSEKLLNGCAVLKNCRVLDVGAGASPDLAGYVGGRQGKYFALDLNAAMLSRLAGGVVELRAAQGNAVKLPFRNESMDVVHQRFVLNGIVSPEDRRAEIAELVRVVKAGGSVFLLEYDWSTLHSTVNTATVERLHDLFRSISEFFRMDRFVGIHLESLARQVLSNNFTIHADHFSRPEKDYTFELADPEYGLCVSFGARLEQRLSQRPLLAGDAWRECAKLRADLRVMAQDLAARPIQFVPPDIVGVTIKRIG